VRSSEVEQDDEITKVTHISPWDIDYTVHTFCIKSPNSYKKYWS